MRPPFSYYGGKTLLAPRIVDLLPEHGHYVEPFAGSLAVLLAKEPSRVETVNDLNGDLMTFWRVLRDRPDELIQACSLTPHSRAEFRQCADRSGCDDLERARRVWVYLAQGRSGRMHHTGWRYSINPGTSASARFPTWIERIPEAAARLASVSLECLPALDLIRRYGEHPDVLIYADPPYLGETRSGSGYQVDMREEESHRELAAALQACRAAVVLSGYASPLYAEIYDGWHVRTLRGSTQQSEGRTEVLWSNRILAPDLLLTG